MGDANFQERGSLFALGERVELDNGNFGIPRFIPGVIAEVVKGEATGYRITWDDGYVDPPGAPLYFTSSLRKERS